MMHINNNFILNHFSHTFRKHKLQNMQTVKKNVNKHNKKKNEILCASIRVYGSRDTSKNIRSLEENHLRIGNEYECHDFTISKTEIGQSRRPFGK